MAGDDLLDLDDGALLARESTLSHPRKRSMVLALARTGNVSASARAAGISRSTHYEWLRTDEEYAKAVDEAMEDAADVLEAVARRRAIVGSDTLLIFLLKAIRPEKFRERYEVQHKEPQSVAEFFRRVAEKRDGQGNRLPGAETT